MKHEDKQPGIEEKEGTMSRHLDAVATSTLHLKQLRHQLKGRKLSRQQLYREVVATTSGCRDNCTEKLSRQHQDVAKTIVQRRGRDNTRLSQQQLYREVVTTTSRCRDNNCTEKRSRQHQDVATTIVQRRGRDNTRLSRQQMQGPECRDVNKMSRRQKRSRQEQAVATPPSLKTCRNNTETPATRHATRTATTSGCRDDGSLCRDTISLLGQFTKVQKEMHRN